MKKLIGHIGVDAGLCWVGDPCYVMGDDASSRVRDWGELCNLFDKHKSDDGNWSTPLGGGTGFAISTGYGDGSYPVYIEISDKRVKSITIKFMEEN